MSNNPDEKLIITDHPDIESARRAQERKAFLEAEEEKEKQQKAKRKDDDAPKSNIIITDDPSIESARRSHARKMAREAEEEQARQQAMLNANREAGIDLRTGKRRVEPTWDDLKFAALVSPQDKGANDNLRDVLGKPANDVLAMGSAQPAAGQQVLGHAVTNLGTGASDSRLKTVAKAVGGMAVPAVATFAAKTAFALAATAAFPAYAPLVVPVVFAAWSILSLTKSARAIMHDLNETSAAIQERDKVGKAKAFRMALNQNKFKTGMLIGSAVMLTLGLTGTLDNLVEPAAKFVSGSDLGSKLSGVLEAAAPLGGNSSASHSAMGVGMMPLTPDQISALPLEVENPATPTAATPVTGTAPVPVVEPTELAKVPQDQFRELIANQNVSPDVKEAAERMLSTDPKIAAQATKDAAFHLLNGIGMDGGNEKLALALLKDAADAGNVQAKVDLAYLQYHGLAGVEAEPKAALAAMQEIKTDARAANFVSAWTGHATQATPVMTAPASTTSSFVQLPEPATADAPIPAAAPAESQFIRQPTPQEILQEKMNAAGDRAFSSDPAVAQAAKLEWAELNRQMEALNKGGEAAATATAQADAKSAAPATPTDTRTAAQTAKDVLDKAKTVQTAATDLGRIKDGIDIMRRR